MTGQSDGGRLIRFHKQTLEGMSAHKDHCHWNHRFNFDLTRLHRLRYERWSFLAYQRWFAECRAFNNLHNSYGSMSNIVANDNTANLHVLARSHFYMMNDMSKVSDRSDVDVIYWSMAASNSQDFPFPVPILFLAIICFQSR